MKKYLILASVFLFVFGIVGSVSAVTISYEYAISSDTTLTTPYSWATVETFDSGLLWTWAGQGQIVTGGQPPPEYAAPYDSNLMPAADPTKYVTVPNASDADASGSYTATGLGGTYNYFGIFWGSVDTYNTLSFYNGFTEVASFTGTAITLPNPANGNQTAPSTNLYVNLFYLPDFDSFKMSSTNFAFEADNIAVGIAPVPEPATMLLLASGLAGLAGLRRKFKKG